MSIKKIISAFEFDMRDAFVFGGIILVSIGAGLMYLPAAFVTAGALLFYVGVRQWG